MKTFVLGLGAILVMGAGPSQAQTLIADTDGDGVYALEELRAAFPDMTEQHFLAADTNANGKIDMEELAAAIQSGKIPS